MTGTAMNYKIQKYMKVWKQIRYKTNIIDTEGNSYSDKKNSKINEFYALFILNNFYFIFLIFFNFFFS